MASPNITAKAPKEIELEAGKTYSWCACGASKNQPFCDGSHKGSPFSPKVFKAEVSRTAYLCMCKHTSNQPFCDGAHKEL